MRDLLARLWARLSNPVKAGAVTAFFTFVTLFGASLIGWVQAVVDWATSSGAGEFPDVSVLGKAAVSAAAAALTGLVNFVARQLQDAGVLPGSAPSYGTPTVKVTADLSPYTDAVDAAKRSEPPG